jgi:hypothetical protein
MWLVGTNTLKSAMSPSSFCTPRRVPSVRQRRGRGARCLPHVVTTLRSDGRKVGEGGERVMWDLEDTLARDEAERVLACTRVADEHTFTERLRIL